MSSAGNNFAALLVERLGRTSCLTDAVTGHGCRPGELPQRIAATAAALRAAGLAPGDRLLLGCSLTPASALVYLGAMYAGLVAVPVDERLLTAAGDAMVDLTGAGAAWTETELRRTGEWQGHLLLLHGDLSAGPAEISPMACRESDLAALMATSGSTGTPRFVMVTHGNLAANTEAIIRSQQLREDERAMLILPVSYCFGASVLHSHLYCGGSVVFDRRFMFPDRVLEAMAQYECTSFAGVPTVYNALLRRSRLRQIAFPRLRRFLQAGGALAPEKIREMRAAVPTAKFHVMYGQTEATARISCMEPERWEEKTGSAGRPLDNLAVRIVDDQGTCVATGETGELLVSGPSICIGYWKDEAQTGRRFRDGWLYTGDLARQDAEGYLWIEGRKEAFLKMRGMRVSFAEVEARVGAIPEIYECAVSAVAHPVAGEALVLYIVPNRGATVSEQDVRRQLPPHWTLDSLHVVAELPKTPAGKVSLAMLSG